jgi:hypothetical protein
LNNCHETPKDSLGIENHRIVDFSNFRVLKHVPFAENLSVDVSSHSAGAVFIFEEFMDTSGPGIAAIAVRKFDDKDHQQVDQNDQTNRCPLLPHHSNVHEKSLELRIGGYFCCYKSEVKKSHSSISDTEALENTHDPKLLKSHANSRAEEESEEEQNQRSLKEGFESNFGQSSSTLLL